MPGQRKTVTILFSDLVESTALAETLDPEELGELLSTYFASMRSTIERYGGRVEKFIGDAVVGMFGVPTTHEDDALRAVRAAVEMQAALTGLNAGLTARHGVRLAARIGINTGEVVVSGDGSGRDGGIALGHAINMAARIEQAAGAGDVLVGARTWELVKATVDAKAVGPLAVKGSSVPIGAWRVGRVRDDDPRGAASSGLFVGRGHELAAIQAAFETARGQRACVVTTVVAPPGMGKSRLAAEVIRTLRDDATVLVGRCRPYGEGVTYLPLIEIATTDSLPTDVAHVVRARQALTDSAGASPEETAWVFKQMLEALAEERPVVAVIDDLHWAEPLLMDVLDYVATFSIDRPIMLLCLARPDLFDNRPDWAEPRAHAVTIRLEPLSRTETEALLAADEAATSDPELRSRIVDAAGGVPLFVQQMAALSLEGGAGVPPTVRALLAARVDRLHDGERVVLEAAAVQGEIFDRPTIAAVAGALDAPLGSTLMGLVRREFVRPERSIDGGERFRFSHALLRDAVYEQMPRRLRSQLHERYADLLASAAGDPEVVAHHLERAHAERALIASSDLSTDELALRAGRALHAAGRRALGRKEWRHARELLERSRPLLAFEAAEELRVLPDLIQAAGEQADLDFATDVYTEALASARSIGDVSTELRGEIAWAHIQIRRGDAEMREQVPAIASRAEHHFANQGDDSALAGALLLRATARTLPTSQIIEILRRAQAHAERAGDERAQTEIWDELGGSMIFGPTPYPEILEYARRELAWASERGIAFAEADGLLAEAYAVAASGDTEHARAGVAKVRDLFAQLPGFVSQLGEADILAASVEIHAGDLLAAEASYRRAIEVLDTAGHVPWWTAATLGLASVLLDLGRAEEAASALEEVEQRGLVWSAGERTAHLQARAKLASARGDLEAAIDLARKAVAAVSDVDTPEYAARAHELLGDFLAAAGDAPASTEALERAQRLYDAKGYVPGQRRVSTKLRSRARPPV